MKPANQATGIPRILSFGVLAAMTVVICAGCRTARPLPAADFSKPGWTVLQGTAIWKPSTRRPELAGDLLLATNANGNCFVQFSKMPFPLATAQVAGDQWRIEFGTGKYAWRGRGAPPARFCWFRLPGALLGASPGGNWRFTHPEINFWRLENPRTGENLEGEFSP